MLLQRGGKKEAETTAETKTGEIEVETEKEANRTQAGALPVEADGTPMSNLASGPIEADEQTNVQEEKRPEESVLKNCNKQINIDEKEVKKTVEAIDENVADGSAEDWSVIKAEGDQNEDQKEKNDGKVMVNEFVKEDEKVNEPDAKRARIV